MIINTQWCTNTYKQAKKAYAIKRLLSDNYISNEIQMVRQLFFLLFPVKPVATNICPKSQGGTWQTITNDLVSISCQKGDAHFHRKCDLLKGTLCPQAQKYWVINYCAGTTKNVVTKATRCSRWKALLVINSFCPKPICFSYKNETKFCPTGV